MAIVSLKRFWIAVSKENEEKLVSLLKDYSLVHWEDLSPEESSLDSEFSVIINKLEEIIKLLFKIFPEKRGFLEGFFGGRPEISKEELEKLRKEVNWEDLYKKAKNIERSLILLEEKEKFLQTLYEETLYWEDLDESLDFSRNLKRFLFYSGSFLKENFEKFKEESREILDRGWIKYWEKEKQIKCIFIVLKEDKDKIENLLQKYKFEFHRIPYLRGKPSENIERIKKYFEKLRKELEETLESAKELYDKKHNLLAWYDYFYIKSQEKNFKNFSFDSKYFVVYSGWIPTKIKEKFVNELKEKLGDFVWEEREPLPEEEPPVLLENPKIFKPFEFLTKLYGLPPYRALDPTPFTAPFYLLFFGICVGDFGYGLLLLLFSLWIKKKFKPEGSAKELMDLLSVLSIPSIIVGIITWSFFGNQIFLGPDGKFLGVLPIINPSVDLIKALSIALLIGIVSQFYALILRFISSWKKRDYESALFDALLWIIFLGSILFYVYSRFQNISSLGLIRYLLVLSLIGLILTQGREYKGIVRIIVGLISIYGILGGYGITSFIGDILSYSRLFALNLVSSIFGFVITQLSEMVGNIPFLGWILFSIIWIAGQLLNFILSVLGAFVHSTRLQFLEIFGRFYSSGGRNFKTFKIDGKYFKLKESR
ncbi:MAG: ATPase [Dictyoglomus sp.]|nr:ATPase [Dictyoglomus sp.]MCX7942014.1 ATPase [Dictyoglomaceae bacterium]MDW8188724.1 V-type ATPase 116kDa subunit family protein [Dictyoglomus sp.]